MHRKVVVEFLLGFIATASVPALAGPVEEAAKAFKDGHTLLAKAMFPEALEAFKIAAKGDAENQEYRQSYAMVRQVIRLREEIESTQDADRWMSIARALRTFYHDHKVYSESLPLDREIHAKGLALDSAAMLAETLIALEENAEAATVLRESGKKSAAPRDQILLGLALARQGGIDDAKGILAKVDVSEESSPRVFYELARLHALVGDSNGALKALARSVELTLPSRVDQFKTEAKSCRDFGTLASTAGFAQVLATESQVSESKCSKGPACSKCPMRAKCSSKSDGD
jgi:predicted Zn-dependent protease